MTDLARNTIQPFNYFHLLDTQKLDCKRKILSLEKDTAIEKYEICFLIYIHHVAKLHFDI